MANWNNQLKHNKYGAGRHCFQCKDRKIGCHSTCEKYIQATKEAKEWREMVENKRNEEKEINQYRKRAVSKGLERKRKNTQK